MKKIFFALLISYFSSSYSQTDYSYIYDNESILKNGVSLYEKEKYAEAIKQYEKISKTDPKFLDGQYEKAMALSTLEKKDELKAFFEDLYNKNLMQEFPSLYTLYGSFLSDQKDYEQAEKIFKEGEKYLPDSSSFLYNFAILYVRKDETQKSVELLEHIITINPNHASSHYLLGALALDNGKITQATLALLSYLIIAPKGHYAEKAILNLNAKFGENYLGKNKLVFSKSGDNFEEIEEILKNQLPLNTAYKVKSEIDDVIIRQVQAVAEYSQGHKMGDGFFETTYIPWIKDMMDKNRFEGFSYYILQAMEEKIGKRLTSQKKKITDFNDNYVAKDLWSFYGKRTMDIFGKKEDVIVSLKGGNPHLIGQLINNKKEGKFKYLYESGNLAGELNFKNDELNESQKYYDEKGKISEEKSFNNGKVNGTRTAYFTNGALSLVENYKEDILNGISTSYYVNGGKQCEVNFENGERKGKLVCLYPNGTKKSESNYIKGKLNGPYSSYNEIGDMIESYSCINDLIEGNYKEYYDGKLVKTEAVYANGKIQNTSKSYSSSNSIDREFSYENGKIRKSVNYYPNGKKSTESLYNEKEELETFSYFDENENKYFEEKYKSRELKSGLQYSKKNPEPIEVSLSSKPFVMKDYEENILASGNFERGKKTGEWNHKYASGTNRLKEFYSLGKPNGLSQDYDRNGLISSIKNYTNDTLNGLYEVYENGVINRTFSYKKGKQNGPYKTFYPDGSLNFEAYLVDGATNFDKLGYWQNGTISNKDKYIDDVLTFSESCNTKGEKENSFDYKDKTGKFTEISNNGTITKVYALVNGELNGKYVEKDKLNNPTLETEYINGVRYAICKSYSPLGTIQRESNYYSGKLNGTDKIYDLVGNLRLSSSNTFGDDNGNVIRYYHTKGKMIEHKQFNGFIDGESTYFNQKGDAILIIGYQYDIPKYYIKKSKTGNLDARIEIKDETANVSSLYPNGNMAIQLNLVKGNFEGKIAINNELGKTEFEVNYLKNLLNGERIEYYTNGNVYKKERFKNNNFEGLQEYYTEEGKPWLSLEYKNDELHGNTLIYSEGKLIITKKYDSDELVEIIK